jgi:UTP--glucose-1-phosphate uridylyltransferase
MQVRKAIITAAGRGSANSPALTAGQQAMLPMVDRDGLVKPVIQIIAEEALDSGIEEICVVTAPGDEAVYRSHFAALGRLLGEHGETGWMQEQRKRLADLERRLTFAVQEQPTGYGQAVWCAREFTGAEPFLLLVSDHLYVSGEARRCARQVIDLAVEQDCSVAAVQATREHLIQQYGTLSGKRVSGLSNTFQIESILEKPTPTSAEQSLQVPGLRVGHYLCFFGMHVLTPTIFKILDEQVTEAGNGGDIQLTPALQQLARTEKYLAVQTNGRRYNIGVKFGSLEAQIALAMAGRDRDEVLIRLMELLIQAGVRAETV